ncbi:MAG: hypothetical protein M3Q48_09390 [Actinomycetota bacterium]|nr:hypothetical protein [Actinomycetota bacterium]
MPSRRRTALVALFVLGLHGASLPTAPRASAYAGALDANFADNGLAVVDAGRGKDEGTAVVAHTDGAVVVAGPASRGQDGHAVAMARVLPDGSLDRRFGTAGRVLVAATLPPVNLVGLAARPDGRLVAVVPSYTGESLLLFGHLADGRPDPGFGTNGRAEVAMAEGTRARPEAFVGVQPITGQLVVATTAHSAAGSAPFVTRLLGDGTPDPTFGVLGRALFDPAGEQLSAHGMDFDADGRVVIAGGGRASAGASSVMAVSVLLANGVADPLFADDGTATVDGGPGIELATGVAVDQVGRIVLLGAGPVTPYMGGEEGLPGVVVARVLPSGVLDPLFGVGGLATAASLHGGGVAPTAVAIDSAGRVVVAGRLLDLPGDADAWAVRLLPVGVQDPTFGEAGEVVLDPGRDHHDAAVALALDADRPVLVGFTGADTLVARLGSDGAPDPAFGHGGVAEVNTGVNNDDYVHDSVLLPDGDMVVVGMTMWFNAASALVARLDPNGSLDAAFGDGGVSTVDLGTYASESIAAVALAPDGDLVLAGAVSEAETSVLVMRMGGDGRLDDGFGDGGVLVLDSPSDGGGWASSVVVAPDGRIVVSVNQGPAQPTLLVGLLPDGALDPSFGGGAPVPTAILNDPDPWTPAVPALALDGGGVLVAGPVPGAGGRDLGVARHLLDGSVDASFGAAGLAQVDVGGAGRDDVARALAAGPTGIVVAGGTVVDDRYPEPRRDVAVARFSRGGTLHASFGAGGSVVLDLPHADTPADAVSLLPDGRIALAARSRIGVRVVRLHADGTPDTAFDGDGFVAVPRGAQSEVDLDVLPDGRLVAASSVVHTAGRPDILVARLEGADEPLATFSTADVTVVEGEGGYLEIPVLLSEAVGWETTVSVRVLAASAGTYDYSRGEGRLRFAPGQTRATMQGSITDDDIDEVDETFTVELWDPAGAGIGDGRATIRIVDEDPGPVLTVADATVTEGAAAAFGFELSEPSPAPVRVIATALDGSAREIHDYAASYARFEIPPGEVRWTVVVPTVADDADEPDETFSLVLSHVDNARPARNSATGTIVDDEAPPAPTTTTAPTTTSTSPAPGATTTTTAPRPVTTTTTAPTTTTTTSVPAPAPPPAARSGYWMLDRTGTVYAFGDAPHHGEAGERDAVDIEPAPGGGYWVANAAGGVTAFGGAPVLGSVPSGSLGKGEAVTSFSAHPQGGGYWLFTTRGRVLPVGTARFLGDMSRVALNGPVLDSVATPSGAGYYMVASDGGIFAFGDAAFRGSMGGTRLNAPVQSLVPDGDGAGYWLVAADGGVFAFDAPFRGSMGGARLNRPVTGMVRFGSGYLMVAEDGGIFSFSDRPFHGSLGDRPPAAPVVAVAPLG